MSSRAACPFLALAALLLPVAAGAQLPAERLLVCDQDAHLGPGSTAGAVFNHEIAAGTTADPGVEVAADLGVAFEYLSGLVVSPVDGRAYVTDLGAGAGSAWRVEGGTGAAERLTAADALMPEPFGAGFLPDGRMVIADLDSDPAGLGPDSGGFPGHGAILVVDPRGGCAPSCAIEVLSDGTRHPGFPGAFDSAFEDPVGVAYDPVADVLYVADAFADPLDLGHLGALFAVDVATGFVDLVSSSSQFLALTGVAVRADGRVLLLDSIRDDSIVWEVDPTVDDPEANFSYFSGGLQYALLEGVAVDSVDRVFVVDSGEWDAGTLTFVIPPALFRVDDGAPSQANAILVNESVSLLLPVGLAAVAVPQVASVAPSALGLPTTLVLSGNGLSETTRFDFGPQLALGLPLVPPGVPAGTRVDLEATPVPGTGLPVAPPGCAAGGLPLDLAALAAFGGGRTLSAAVLAYDALAYTPQPPCSRRGDASCDGIVDGVDLAVVGMAFASSLCNGPPFDEDADFNDDGTVDGMDLAILATFFGTRP